MKFKGLSVNDKQLTPQKSILNSLIFSSLTIFSRCWGLIRDQIKSYAFGTSIFAVTFDIAYQLPNIFRSLLAEGAITQIIIPMYSKIKKDKKHEEALIEIGFLISWVLVFVILFSILLIFLLPNIVGFLTHDFTLQTEKAILTLEFSRILFPTLIFFSVASIFMALQYNHGIYITSSFGPALLNILIITFFGSYLFIYKNESDTKNTIRAFSYIILVSTFIQMVFQIAVCYKSNIKLKFNLILKKNNALSKLKIKEFFFNFMVTIISTLAYQLSFVMDIYLAGFIKDVPGSISALSYSQRLIQLPVSIIGVSFMTGLLPILSQNYLKKSKQEYFNILFIGIRFILLLSIPASIGLFFLQNLSLKLFLKEVLLMPYLHLSLPLLYNIILWELLVIL